MILGIQVQTLTHLKSLKFLGCDETSFLLAETYKHVSGKFLFNDICTDYSKRNCNYMTWRDYNVYGCLNAVEVCTQARQ